ncbi:5964_t:CDS:1, partial [Acaulospora colombiana]
HGGGEWKADVNMFRNAELMGRDQDAGDKKRSQRWLQRDEYELMPRELDLRYKNVAGGSMLIEMMLMTMEC